MNYNCEITVIVCTYKPNLTKLISTLKSIVLQKGVEMQIIVTDDGSEVSYFDEVKYFFSMYPEIEYELIENEKNIGTVNNIYNAIQSAKGKYTYVISPGDYFFAANTLSQLVFFSEKNDIEIAFGKSQYYKFENNSIKLLSKMNPCSPELYNLSWLSNKMKALAYCTTQDIVGASFFRRTDVFSEYLSKIIGLSKYDEDNATSYVHVLQKNKPIYYLDEFVVWYEYGTGISTSNSKKFLEELANDCKTVLRDIRDNNNSLIIDYMLESNKKSYFLKHPILYIKILFIRVIGKMYRYKKFLVSSNSFFDEITKH
ncbi:MAG: glycosyltransferase [Erysipelotrichaceae bacterium]